MTVSAPGHDCLRTQVTAKVRQGLVPALGAGTDSGEAVPSQEREGYDDFRLRSIAGPASDALPNKDAIADAGARGRNGPFLRARLECARVGYYFDVAGYFKRWRRP